MRAFYGGTGIDEVEPSYRDDRVSGKQVAVERKTDYRPKDGAGWKIVDGGTVLATAKVSYGESTKVEPLESYRDDVPPGGVRTSDQIKVQASPFTDTHRGRVDGVFTELDFDLLAWRRATGHGNPFMTRRAW